LTLLQKGTTIVPFMKFDAVIGNPPYNASRVAGKGSTSVLWDKFTVSSVNSLTSNGYLLYVHPSPWRKPEHKMWKYLTANCIKFIKIFSLKDSVDIFDAGTRSDYYLLKKQESTYTDLTTVIDESGKSININLKKLPWLPSNKIKKVLKYVSTNEAECLNVLYDTAYHGVHTKEAPEGEYINEVIQSITKDGPRFRYDNHRNGHYKVSKVIVNESGTPYPINDFEGKYAMSQDVFGIIVNSNEMAENLVKAIGSEKFKSEIISSTKWSTFRTDYRMFRYFKKDFYLDFL